MLERMESPFSLLCMEESDHFYIYGIKKMCNVFRDKMRIWII